MVVVICDHYESKEWCGLEWDAIFDLLKKRRNEDVMLCRFDFATVKGLYSTAGFLDLDGKTPELMATRILERLAINEGNPKNYYVEAPQRAPSKLRGHEKDEPLFIQGTLERVLDAIRDERYDDAIRFARPLVDRLDADRDITGIANVLARRKTLDSQVYEAMARALARQEFAVGMHNKHQAAQVMNYWCKRFADSAEPGLELREWFAKMLFCKALTLQRLAVYSPDRDPVLRYQEATQVFDELLERHHDAVEPALLGIVASSLLEKGAVLAELHRAQEQIQCLEELIRRFGNASESDAWTYSGYSVPNLVTRAREQVQILKRMVE